VPGAQDALAWFDTLRTMEGGRGGWDGFDATLARATVGTDLMSRPTSGWRPRADLALTNGGFGLGDHALTLWRGDSLSAVRVDVASGERAAEGALAGGGRDLYDVAGAVARGRHTIEGGFAHRRSLASLAGGESEEARGEAGYGRYRFQSARWRLDAAFTRGYTRHLSQDAALTPGVRLADENAAHVDLERAGPSSRLAARWSWSDGHVAPTGGARDHAVAHWGALRWEGPFGEGRLEAAVGVGHQSVVGRTVAAPSLAWRFAALPWTARVVVERVTTPVWSDLAAGQSAFLQDTWVTGIDAGTGPTARGRVHVSLLAGRSHDRALIERLPLEALALRAGYRADPHAYDFGLLVGEAMWRSTHWGAGLEGFALTRDSSPLQPRVDPGGGGRVYLEARARFFQGDLRVRPRIEASGIGRRESEAVAAHSLPGYVTLGAGLELTLADAALLLEGRNLEGRARPQTWVDSATGSDALGPGRELRATFTWRFWN